MQPPLDIPSRRQSSSSRLFSGLDDSHFLVGSPDPLTSEHSFSFHDTDVGSENALPTTPLLNSQSLPSASIPRRRATTVHSVGTPSPRTARSLRERNPEHQWSLFGQLMENEGYLSPNTNTQRGHRQTNNVEDLAGDTASTASGLSPLVRSYHSRGLEGYNDDSPGNVTFISPATPANDLALSNDQYDSDGDSSTVSIQQTNSFFSKLPQCFPCGRYLLSPTSKNVLKCAIAYLLASLFTFTPFLSQFISDIDYSAASASGHMVATIAVYFNPAKTVGAMIEADLFCLIGMLYASLVCLVSMNMFWWFEVQPGWEWAADLIALGWIGLSFGAMAWMKVWMENPSFNTACSMTAIIIFIVVIKEGGLTTLLHVCGIIVCGSAISNLVCFLLWPQTARSNLQLSMTKTLDSFSTLLPMVTSIFLLEDDEGTGPRATDLNKIQHAVENHQNSFISLRKSLREAKSEWMLTRTPWEESHDSGSRTNEIFPMISGKESYEDTVDCLNRLAQHLNGLRSSTRLQHDITNAGIKNHPSNRGKGKATDPDDIDTAGSEANALRAAAAMFGELVDELGPPMKALSMASTLTLNKLRVVCMQSRRERINNSDVQPHEFSDLVDGIQAALMRFESTSNHAVLRIYRRTDIHKSMSQLQDSQVRLRNHSVETESESVFLVYFFIFTLQEFAKELISLVDSVERVYCYEQRMLQRRAWWSRLPTWMQLTWTNLKTKKSSNGNRPSLGFRKSLSYMIPHHRINHPAFPKIRPHAPDTIQTPPRSKLTMIGKFKQILWIIGKRLKERDTKYAIKAGLATTLLALPAFLDSTRPTFVAYWGDWALISFFVVISPTIGATNYLSLQRFLGTLFGAAVAVVFYSLFPDDAVVLSIGGFLFSLPCFYYAVAKPQYLSASRFVLLTYNLTCLFCYNLRQRDISVIDIGLHRAIAVVAGILWAAFVSRFWWPSEARRELSNTLSEFCLHLGWLYTRLVASNSFAPEYKQKNLYPESSSRNLGRDTQVTRLNNSIHEFMAMELHLQIKLIELQTLLGQAQHEPRLKGPFPVDLYRDILTSLQTILDKLHSMRCVTTREEWYTSVRQDFILPVNKERREMVGNIMLSFSILAASFRLKAPLPPYLPPVEKSRLRLVEAIRKLDIVKNRDVKLSRQLLFFAYALTMKGVTVELETLGRTLQDAFGVIGQTSDEFEMLFLPLEESLGSIDHEVA